MSSMPVPGPIDPVAVDGDTEPDARPSGSAHGLDPGERAVAFARAIASSSLGTPDARRRRLAGRRELQRREGPGARRTGGRIGGGSPVVDLRIAEELDRWGYTFESEMFSRRSAGAITHLAVLLEAKGFASESVELYAHAAAESDATSIWRLTALSAQLDGPARTEGLVRAGGSAMSESDRRNAGRCLRQMSRRREDPDLDLGSLVSLLDEQPASSVFALGSILLGMSGRPDLARLAFCSAFARGHAPAAVSLLALADGTAVDRFGPAVRTALDDRPGGTVMAGAGSLRALRGLERFAGALRCDLGDRYSFAALVDLARSGRTRRARSQAQQRVLVAVRILTWLRGAAMLGTGRVARQAVHRVASAVSAQLMEGVHADVPGTALLASAWSTGQRMLARADATSPSGPGTDDVSAAGSGVAIRAGRVLAALPPIQRDVVVLRLAGLCDDDAASVLGTADRRAVAELYAGGVARMWNGQRGEDAVDHALWQEVEDSFLGLPPRSWTTVGSGSVIRDEWG